MILKSLVSHMILAHSRQDLHNKEGEDLTESTSVLPAKYPLKVKLEIFHNFRVLELESIIRTLISESFGFL